jgi:polyisoprenoid-binding protein YceI
MSPSPMVCPIQTVADLTTSTIEFSVEVNSVDTRNEERDNHLRSADFFDAENFPKMTFKSTEITKKTPGEYEITGDLTIRGTTKPETFLVSYEGSGKDLWGNVKVGFEAHGSISRSEYGQKFCLQFFNIFHFSTIGPDYGRRDWIHYIIKS